MTSHQQVQGWLKGINSTGAALAHDMGDGMDILCELKEIQLKNYQDLNSRLFLHTQK